MTENTDLSPIANDVRRFDYDRWLSCLFAPKGPRECLFAILAFNIEIARVRETVSEPLLGDIRLQWWRDALTGLTGNISKPHPVVEALHSFNRQQPIDFNLMLEMVDMRAKDLDPAPIESTGDLLVYADTTGGALHHLMYKALGGADNSKNIEAVVRCGRSYALTGILRAIPFHAQNGLVLIPTKVLTDYSLTDETVFKAENRAAFLEIVRKMAEFTREELRDANLQARNVSKGQKAAVLCNGLSGVYLKQLKKLKYEPADPRMEVGGLRKVLALSMYKLLA